MDGSGVWRFREMLPLFDELDPVVSLGEGATPLIEAPGAALWAGVRSLFVKHQGANPTGSFKDLGMTVCITEARRLGSESSPVPPPATPRPRWPPTPPEPG
jgi:threonine synthase